MLRSGVLVFDLEPGDDWSQDGDALLPALDMLSQLQPPPEPGDARRIWAMQGDEDAVAEAVAVKATLEV
jgi:hypothetical protein